MELINKARSSLTRLLQEIAPSVLRRDAEETVLKALPEAPYPKHPESGVLLSDQIEYYAKKFDMVQPYYDEKLKPAAYELSVGALYSIAGKTYKLSREAGENEIIIRPFEVVIIQTLERLNLPPFLIARWNVRVRWAYKGLLWVGAAQVDPGFKGYLACPLYNLSDKPVTLHYGDEIAVIDFVTTTKPNNSSKRYDPLKRSRLLFEDYEPNKLQSALATQAHDRLERVEHSISELRARIDTSVTVITTAIGILVASLALFSTKQLPEIVSSWSPTLAVATLAVVIALMAYIHTIYRHLFLDKRRLTKWIGLELVVFLLLLFAVVQLFNVNSSLKLKPVPMRPNGSNTFTPPT